ncbi:hypothetical protein REPUB_Repub17cG0073000 [Reevesia pubescens]
MLSSCSELATLGQGQQIHADVIKTGASSVIGVISTLISMYSRCGCLEDSIKVFMECEEADLVSWSSMLAAYGFHGRGVEVVELFEQMEQEKLEPNDVNFLSLLYAFSHPGLKDKGLKHGKKIAQEVLKLDPQDSASYVLLSNIHASQVRKAMRDRAAKKEPCVSRLEIKNQVHEFCTSDKAHPEWKEIDSYLKEPTAEMKLHGYVPDTGSVLHNMDNEEKEYNLVRHIEKMAIAFALMNTPLLVLL